MAGVVERADSAATFQTVAEEGKFLRNVLGWYEGIDPTYRRTDTGVSARLSWGRGKAQVTLEVHGHGTLREATAALIDAATTCRERPRPWERLALEMTRGATLAVSFANTVPVGPPLFTCMLDFRGTHVTSPALPTKLESLSAAVEMAREQGLVPDEAVAGATDTGVADKRAAPRRRVVECEKAIRERFPQLLAIPPRPMKIGTLRQVIEALVPPLSKHDVSHVIARHATSRAYLAALAAGGDRYDADGQPAGAVSAAHRRHAQLVLETIPDGPQGLNAKGATEMYHSKLLKMYESANLPGEREFAEAQGLDEVLLQRELVLARKEREARHQRRRDLAAHFASTGLSEEEYVAKYAPSLTVFRKALEHARASS